MRRFLVCVAAGALLVASPCPARVPSSDVMALASLVQRANADAKDTAGIGQDANNTYGPLSAQSSCYWELTLRKMEMANQTRTVWELTMLSSLSDSASDRDHVSDVDQEEIKILRYDTAQAHARANEIAGICSQVSGVAEQAERLKSLSDDVNAVLDTLETHLR